MYQRGPMDQREQYFIKIINSRETGFFKGKAFHAGKLNTEIFTR